MPKIPTTIGEKFRPEWTFVDGIREMISNGIDAEKSSGATLTVDYVPDVCDGGLGRVRVENEGVILDREALILGESSKRGRSDMIGVHGDGMKSGALALVRDGYPVKIRNGAEVWTFTIERSDQFKANVLTIDVATGRKDSPRVRVEIDNVSPEQWAEVRRRFLVLDPRKPVRVETDHGELILGDAMKGRVYVKGVFVEHDPELGYGYNLTEASVDLERKCVDSYDKRSAMRRIWTEASVRRPDLLRAFTTMLDSGAPDLAGIDPWNAYEVPAEIASTIAADFLDRHGPDAIVCSSTQETVEAAHLGKQGVLVRPGAAAILTKRANVESFDRAKARLERETLESFGLDALTDAEQDTIAYALDIVRAVRPDAQLDVDVVTFRNPALGGLARGDGKIEIARRCLTSTKAALGVLVHELAHVESGAGDGDKRHVQAIETLWGDVAAHLAGWGA